MFSLQVLVTEKSLLSVYDAGNNVLFHVLVYLRFLTVATCFTDSFSYSRFNIDNKYGRAALEATFKAIMGYEQPIVKAPTDYKGDFFKGKHFEKHFVFFN